MQAYLIKLEISQQIRVNQSHKYFLTYMLETVKIGRNVFLLWSFIIQKIIESCDKSYIDNILYTNIIYLIFHWNTHFASEI